MQKFRLNSGYEIPAIGTGTNTFGKVDNRFDGTINDDIKELLSSFECGYRLIDTAILYRNEAVIGKALKASGIDRSELFVTSKIPKDEIYTKDEETIRKTVASSKEALGGDVIDLYLIHHPLESLDENLRVWKVLEKLVKEGEIRSIGVSNFTIEQLDYLIQNSDTVPAVNQIESHPSKWNDEVIEFGNKHGIISQAWYPLKKISDSAMLVLEEVALKHHKTWAQIALRYQIERNVVVIPKSHNPVHQAENINIFDFSLDDEDKIRLKALKD